MATNSAHPSTQGVPSEPWALTIPQTAAALQINESTVRKLLARGELHGRRVGTHWRIPRQALRDYLNTPEKPAAAVLHMRRGAA